MFESCPFKEYEMRRRLFSIRRLWHPTSFRSRKVDRDTRKLVWSSCGSTKQSFIGAHSLHRHLSNRHMAGMLILLCLLLRGLQRGFLAISQICGLGTAGFLYNEEGSHRHAPLRGFSFSFTGFKLPGLRAQVIFSERRSRALRQSNVPDQF